MNYVLKESSWVLKDGDYETGGMRLGKFPVTPEAIRREPNAIPSAALKFWLP